MGEICQEIQQEEAKGTVLLKTERYGTCRARDDGLVVEILEALQDISKRRGYLAGQTTLCVQSESILS